MKSQRMLFVLMALCAGGIFLSATSAAMPPKGEPGDDSMMPPKEMMEHAGMMGKHHGMMGQRPPMCPMMKGMMEKKVVATSDGGVVVLVGNKLVKYDKDLNLVKEVEIKIDMAAMQKSMMEMMKDCPMMKGGMGQMMEAEDDEDLGDGVPAEPSATQKPAGK